MHSTKEKIGVSLIASLFFTLLTIGVVWVIGGTIFPFIYLLALIISTLLYGGNTTKEKTFTLIFSIITIAISLILSAFIFDYSADGQWYHMQGAYALSHGWNPIYLHHNNIIDPVHGSNIWIDHYPKGIEALQASLISLSGNIECGKAINFIVAIATLLLINDFISKEFAFISNRKNWVYSILLVFSPITVCEMYSFYIDLFLYFAVLWLGIGLYSIYKHGISRISMILIMSSIMIGGSLKLTSLFWIGYFLFFGLVFMLIKRQWKSAVSVASVASITLSVCVLTVCWNPFVTNIQDHDNPTYPLSAEDTAKGKIDWGMVNGAQPLYLVYKSRPIQVIVGWTSRPNGGMYSDYIPPYKPSIKNLMKCGSMTDNVGGAGFFFPEILLLSFILLLMCRKSNQRKYLYAGCAILILSLFLLPFGNCYRYLPFFFVLPFIIMIYADRHGNIGGKLPGRIILMLLVLNISIDFAIATGYAVRNSIVLRAYSKEVKATKDPSALITRNWSFLSKTFAPNYSNDKVINAKPTQRYMLIDTQKGDSIWIDTTKVKPIQFAKTRVGKKFFSL